MSDINLLDTKNKVIEFLENTKKELKELSLDFNYEENLSVDTTDKFCWYTNISIYPAKRFDIVEEILEETKICTKLDVASSVCGGSETDEDGNNEVLTGKHGLTFWKRGPYNE